MAATLALAAGIGLGGLNSWLHNLYKYNREAFMNDLQTQQENCYQEDNLRVTMSSMDREEVRDLTEAGISRINYAILVTTVILALAGELLFEGQIPRDCADFVLNAYMLCLVSTVFHLFLAIMFGLMASFRAQKVSALVLTRQIRPQWQLHFSRMMFGSREEETRAFEEQPLAKILRLPLYERFLAREASSNGELEVQDAENYYSLSNGSAAGTPRSVTGPSRRAWSPPSPSFGAGRRAWSPPSFGRGSSDPDLAHGSPRSLRSQPSASFACDLWCACEAQWRHLSQCMFKCAAFGATSLLEACHYLSLGMLYSAYSDSAWVFWVVHIVFTSLLILIFRFLIVNREAKRLLDGVAAPCRAASRRIVWGHAHRYTAIAVLLTLGPITGGIAAFTEWLWFDHILVPLSYFSHFVVNVVFTRIFFLEESEAEKHMPAEGTSETGIDVQFRREWALELRRQQRGVTLCGMSLICCLWALLFLWSTGVWGNEGNELRYKNSEAVHLPELWGHTQLQLAPLDMEPSSFFTPRALACPGSEVFMADEYKVYRLKNRAVSAYGHCNITLPVADLAARCNDTDCWPIVLLNDGPLPIVFDCATHRREPLLQANSPALRFAKSTSPSGEQDDSFLVVAHPGALTQYFWSDRRRGWVPRWDIDTWAGDEDPGKSVLALDRYRDKILLIHSNNEVVSQDLDTGKTCGPWSIPNSTILIGGGCTSGSFVTFVAADRETAWTLMTAQLPATGFRAGDGCEDSTAGDVEPATSWMPSKTQLLR